MAETPLYNRHDIARYLQHQMSRQEMHAFEKALMDDPFLADAFEGYTASDASLTASHLASIEQQLAGDRKQSKVVPITPAGKPWWKAAVVAAAVTATSLTLFLLQKKQPEPLAVNKTPTGTTYRQSPAGNESYAAAKPALRSTPATAGREEAASVRRPAPVLQALALRAAASPALSADTTVYLAAADTAGPQLSRSTAAAFQNMSKAARVPARPDRPAAPVPYVFKGKVTDVNGTPLAWASILNNSTHKSAVSDAQGNFMLEGTDSVTTLTVSTLGYASVTTVLSSSENPAIMLEKSDLALSEVVIGSGTTKKRSGALPDSSTVAEPVGGWKNFRQYFNRRIDSLQVKNKKTPYRNDEVVLEFLIDEEGNPVNIKVKEQSNGTVAGKVIEILSSGPRWRKKKDDKVRVAIPVGSGR